MPELKNYETRVDAELGKLNAQLQKHGTQNERLRNDYTQLKADVAKLSSKEELEDTKAKFRNELQSAEKSQADSQKEIKTSREKAKVELQGVQNNWRAQLDQCKHSLERELDRATQSLENRLDQVTQSADGRKENSDLLISSLRHDLNDINSVIQGLKNDMNLLRETFENGNQTLKNDFVNRHSIQTAETNRVKEDLRSRIDSLEMTVQRSVEETRNQANRVQDVEQTSARLEKRMHKMVRQLRRDESCCIIL